MDFLGRAGKPLDRASGGVGGRGGRRARRAMAGTPARGGGAQRRRRGHPEGIAGILGGQGRSLVATRAVDVPRPGAAHQRRQVRQEDDPIALRRGGLRRDRGARLAAQAGRLAAMVSMSHGPSVSMVRTSCQPPSSEMAPPCTAKTLPVSEHLSLARYATSGEMFAGLNASNSPSGTSAAKTASIPGVARVSRVRAIGAIALTRAP